MRTRTQAALLSTLVITLILAGGTSSGQEARPAKAAEPPKPVPAYHLDFALSELENGKKINSRQYAMDMIAESTGAMDGRMQDLVGRGKEIKIGTRVPVEFDQGKLQYVDIGTNIWCRLLEDENGLSLSARAEISSLVPRSDTDVYQPPARDPIVRQIDIQASTAITPGKLTSLGLVDDPDSKRQFQLEVTVTKVR